MVKTNLEVERLRDIIRLSFKKKEVYTGEEVLEILKNNGVLLCLCLVVLVQGFL